MGNNALNLAPPPYRTPFLEGPTIGRVWARWMNFLYETVREVGFAGWVEDAIVANQVRVDLGDGLTHQVTLNQPAAVTIMNPMSPEQVPNPSQSLRVIVLQDATGGRPTPNWDIGYAGTVGLAVSPGAGTYTVFDFQVRPDQKLLLVGFLKGQTW